MIGGLLDRWYNEAMRVKLPIVRCRNCSYRWTPRVREVTYCPRCTSTKHLALVEDPDDDPSAERQ